MKNNGKKEEYVFVTATFMPVGDEPKAKAEQKKKRLSSESKKLSEEDLRQVFDEAKKLTSDLIDREVVNKNNFKPRGYSHDGAYGVAVPARPCCCAAVRREQAAMAQQEAWLEKLRASITAEVRASIVALVKTAAEAIATATPEELEAAGLGKLKQNQNKNKELHNAAEAFCSRGCCRF